jgi:hypothetical protein
MARASQFLLDLLGINLGFAESSREQESLSERGKRWRGVCG